MIKNCFIDNKPDYRYDILLDGQKIATGKLMNQYQKAELAKRNLQKKFDQNGQMVQVTKTSQQEMIIDFVYAGLQSWQFDREISRQNISLITQSVLADIFMQINKAQTSSVNEVQTNEKN